MCHRSVLLALIALLCLASHAHAQTPIYTPMCPGGSCQFFDNSGNVAANDKLCTYVAGTSTGLATYADSAGMSSNTNPVILSSAGRNTVFLGNATYKFTLLTAGTDGTCATGSTIWTVDNVPAAAPWNLSSLTGKVQYTTAVLTLSSNTVTPTLNVDGLDTSGGAGTLNTINTTNVASGFELFLYGNNPSSNPVTIASGAGNITLTNGAYTLDAASKWLVLMLRGSTWYEVTRNTFTGLFECAYTKSAQTTSSSPALCTLVEQTSGSSITITLPAASTCTTTNDRIGMKNETANSITVARTGSDTIDGSSSFVTGGVQYESYDFVCNTAKNGWMIR